MTMTLTMIFHFLPVCSERQRQEILCDCILKRTKILQLMQYN